MTQMDLASDFEQKKGCCRSAVDRVAAILMADMVGYSRLMSADEVGTLEALKTSGKNVLRPLVARLRGRIVKFMGDGAMVEFASEVALTAYQSGKIPFVALAAALRRGYDTTQSVGGSAVRPTLFRGGRE
jgi:class 3 adenylate cyclase